MAWGGGDWQEIERVLTSGKNMTGGKMMESGYSFIQLFLCTIARKEEHVTTPSVCTTKKERSKTTINTETKP